MEKALQALPKPLQGQEQGKKSPECPRVPALLYLMLILGVISTVHLEAHRLRVSSPGQDVCHQCLFQFLTYLLHSLFLFPL